MKNGVAECLLGVVDVSSVAEAGQNGVLVRRVRRCVIEVCMIDVGLRHLRGNSSVDMANVQSPVARRGYRLEQSHLQAPERGRQ